MNYIANPKCINERVEDGVIILNEENGNTIVLNLPERRRSGTMRKSMWSVCRRSGKRSSR